MHLNTGRLNLSQNCLLDVIIIIICTQDSFAEKQNFWFSMIFFEIKTKN